MKLPNGDQAVVEDQKLLGYVLNPLHPTGKAHARLFDLLLGINLFNANLLRAALFEFARDGDAIQGKTTAFGTKHEIRFEMTSARGLYNVLSVWIVESGTVHPRLVTAYVE